VPNSERRKVRGLRTQRHRRREKIFHLCGKSFLRARGSPVQVSGSERAWVSKKGEPGVKKGPRQKNLWVNSGSGRRPTGTCASPRARGRRLPSRPCPCCPSSRPRRHSPLLPRACRTRARRGTRCGAKKCIGPCRWVPMGCRPAPLLRLRTARRGIVGRFQRRFGLPGLASRLVYGSGPAPPIHPPWHSNRS